MKHLKTLSIISAALVASITAAAFALSFEAIRQLAIASGFAPGWAWLVPFVVDGSIGVFSVYVLRAALLGEDTRYGWAMVGTFTTVSIIFNVGHSHSSFFAIFISILIPAALFLSFETLMKQLRSMMKSNITTTAARWQARAKYLLCLAKHWRDRAKTLQDHAKTLQDHAKTLQDHAKTLQAELNTAQADATQWEDTATEANTLATQLQAQNQNLQNQINRLQTAATAFGALNPTAQAAALWKSGQYNSLNEAATAAGVSASTISRVASSINGEK